MKNLKPFTRDIALSIVTPEQRIRRQNITSKSSVLKVVSQTFKYMKSTVLGKCYQLHLLTRGSPTVFMSDSKLCPHWAVWAMRKH